jgi:hypothetical protein
MVRDSTDILSQSHKEVFRRVSLWTYDQRRQTAYNSRGPFIGVNDGQRRNNIMPPACGRQAVLKRISSYFNHGICDFPSQGDGIHRGKTGQFLESG